MNYKNLFPIITFHGLNIENFLISRLHISNGYVSRRLLYASWLQCAWIRRNRYSRTRRTYRPSICRIRVVLSRWRECTISEEMTKPYNIIWLLYTFVVIMCVSILKITLSGIWFNINVSFGNNLLTDFIWLQDSKRICSNHSLFQYISNIFSIKSA